MAALQPQFPSPLPLPLLPRQVVVVVGSVVLVAGMVVLVVGREGVTTAVVVVGGVEVVGAVGDELDVVCDEEVGGEALAVDVTVEMGVVTGGGSVGNGPFDPLVMAYRPPRTSLTRLRARTSAVIVLVVSSRSELTPVGSRPLCWLGMAPAGPPTTQLTPANVPNTSSAAVTKATAPEMRRPTRTLLRTENRFLRTGFSARYSATSLASSSGLRRPLRSGYGKLVPVSLPALW